MLKLNINILHIWNYQILIIFGIVFEIFGGLFLSMEAIGLKRFSNIYNYVYFFSKWAKKSLLRMFVLIVPFFLLLSIGLLFNSQVIIGLMMPTILSLCCLSLLIDHPNYYERWVILKTKDGKISPIGFLIIVLGNIFQLISVFWQMVINK